MDQMNEYEEVTPHPARYACHPLPKGEGYISDLGRPCPAEYTSKEYSEVSVSSVLTSLGTRRTRSHY
jgi:hypothetical protein